MALAQNLLFSLLNTLADAERFGLVDLPGFDGTRDGSRKVIAKLAKGHTEAMYNLEDNQQDPTTYSRLTVATHNGTNRKEPNNNRHHVLQLRGIFTDNTIDRDLP